MNILIKVALLSSLTTAALVYVVLEWRPLRTEGSRGPAVSWAEPEPRPSPLPTSVTGALAAAGDLSADEQNNVDVYRKYSTGVVNITSSALALNFYLQPIPIEAGTGSGVILDTNGNIVTNYHVIEPSLNGGGLEVTLADKSKYPAKIIGKDKSNDLSVIRIEAPKEKLSPIPFGRSAGLLVGQKVLAIGNPFGYERTMTTGIISATGRSIRAENDRVIENVIQTDAAINPGNSGGPLLNRAGEIIGINAQIASPSSGSAGIGFAIPSDTVQSVVKDLITYGYVRRPYLGISAVQSMAAYPSGLLRQLGIPSNDGFMITGLSPGGPAQAAGIREVSGQVRYGLRIYPVGGDILVAFQGKEILSPTDVADAIAHMKAGEKVTLTVLRGGRKIDLPVTLKETTAEMQ